jgi:molybdopterin converting factor small subunit
MATIIIPTPLRKFTNNQSKLQVAATTVGEGITKLSADYPELKKHLLDENGQIRSYINIFAGEADIRDLQQEATVLQKDSVISIVPAIAGGII